MKTKQIITAALAILFLISLGYTKAQEKPMKMEHKKTVNVKKADKNKDGKVYVCPGCKVVEDKPGKCPMCGAELKEMSVEKAEQAIKNAKGMHMKMHEAKEMHGKMVEAEEEEVNEHQAAMHRGMQMHKMMNVDVKKADKNKDGKVYVCPGCKVVKDKPGKCPMCGAELKEMSVEKAEQAIKNAKGMHMKMHEAKEMHGKMGEAEEEEGNEHQAAMHRGMQMHKMMKANVEKADKNKDGKVYVCPKCKVVEDKPGKCPMCGAELKEMSVKKAKKMFKSKKK